MTVGAEFQSTELRPHRSHNNNPQERYTVAVLNFIHWVVLWAVLPYVTLGLVGLIYGNERAINIYQEMRYLMKWFGYPYLIFYNLMVQDYAAAGVWFLNLLLSWIGPDDDRWKKRRKKIAAKVKAMNGRLVVVPVTGGSA